MDMIHTTHVHWTSNNQATYTLITTIPHTDPVYLAGGFVHRVLITNTSEHRDVQLCDTDICPTCSGPHVLPAVQHTNALQGEAIKPLVHSQDVQKEGKGWRFAPVEGRKYDAEVPGVTSVRTVKFGDGVEREVQVCDVGECKVCGGERPEERRYENRWRC